MTCTPELVSAYYDGDVSPDEREAIHQHLRSCPECSGLLLSYRRISAELRALPQAPVPAAVDARVRGRLDQLGPSRQRANGGHAWWRGLTAVAASVFIVLSMSAMLRGYDQGTQFAAEPRETPETAQLDARIGRRSVAVAASTAAPQTAGVAEATLTASLLSPKIGTLVTRVPTESSGGGSRDNLPATREQALANKGLPSTVNALQAQAQAPKESPAPGGRPDAGSGDRTKAASVAKPPSPPIGTDRIVEEKSGPSAPKAVPEATATQAEKRAGESRDPDSQRAAATAQLARSTTPSPTDSSVAAVSVSSSITPSHLTATNKPLDFASGAAEANTPACFERSVDFLPRYELLPQDQRILGCSIAARQPITITEQRLEHGYKFMMGDLLGTYSVDDKAGTWSRNDNPARNSRSTDGQSPVLNPAAAGAGLVATTRILADAGGSLGGTTTGERSFSGSLTEFRGGKVVATDHALYVLYADGTWQDYPIPTVRKTLP